MENTRVAEYTTSTDAELVAVCMQAEPQAWKELVHRYSNLIYSIPLKKCSFCPEDAEDIYQSVFETVFEKLCTLEDPGKLRAWIISITWGKSISLARRNQKKPVAVDDVKELAADENHSPVNVLLEHERRKLVGEAVNELSDLRSRAIIECRYYEGMSYEEISNGLGIPIGSIGPMLSRSFAELRKILRRKGVYELL